MKCFNHNEIDAVAQCHNCWIGICRECVWNYTLNNKVTCINCQWQIEKSIKIEKDKIWIYVIIWFLPLIWFLVFMIIWLSMPLLWFNKTEVTYFIQNNNFFFLLLPVLISSFAFWKYTPKFFPYFFFWNWILWLIYLVFICFYLSIKIMMSCLYWLYFWITNIKYLLKNK